MPYLIIDCIPKRCNHLFRAAEFERSQPSGAHVRPPSMDRRGFTLVELLTVVGIVALIAGVAFPTFDAVRNRARHASCAENLRRLGTGLTLYANDHEGWLPPATTEEFMGSHVPGATFRFTLALNQACRSLGLASPSGLEPPPSGFADRRSSIELRGERGTSGRGVEGLDARFRLGRRRGPRRRRRALAPGVAPRGALVGGFPVRPFGRPAIVANPKGLSNASAMGGIENVFHGSVLRFLPLREGRVMRCVHLDRRKGAPGETRTPDLLVRSQALCPLSYRGRGVRRRSPRVRHGLG